MAAQHQILTEEKILNEVVGLDRTGEVCAQYAPLLLALPPGLSFLDPHAIHGKQEGRGEIRPYGFAGEICPIECVPRGTHLVTRERVFRRTALSNERAIELLNGYTIWREHGALIGSPIWHDRRAFLVQPNSHAARG